MEAAIHYPTPLHLQAPGRALGYGPGDFPVCERQAERMLTLPCHEYLTTQEIDYMVACVRGFYGPRPVLIRMVDNRVVGKIRAGNLCTITKGVSERLGEYGG